MNTDWIRTTRQSLPRVGTLLRNMVPTVHLADARDVTAAFLEGRGIRAVLWDVDGTLMSYHARAVDPELAPAVGPILDGGSVRSAILSNCGERRFPELSEIFPDLPIIRAYETKAGAVFRHRLGEQDTHTDTDVRDLLSAGAAPIRKPDARLVRYAMELLEVTDPNATLMIGDQYFTDIVTGNLAGVQSAKVPTFRPDTFPAPVRAGQLLEQAVYRILHGAPGKTTP